MTGMLVDFHLYALTSPACFVFSKTALHLECLSMVVMETGKLSTHFSNSYLRMVGVLKGLSIPEVANIITS